MAKALVFLASGFEEIETVTIVDVLRRAGIEVTVAGLTPNMVKGAHAMKIVPDKNINDVNVDDFDAIVVPGGNPGYKNLRNDPRVITLLKKAFDSNKIVSATTSQTHFPVIWNLLLKIMYDEQGSHYRYGDIFLHWERSGRNDTVFVSGEVWYPFGS